MKRFPANVDIQCDNCFKLCDTPRETSFNKLESPSAASMVSLGLYELLVATIQRFPAVIRIAHDASVALKYVCKHYFADQSRPHYTNGCVALTASLSCHFTDLNTCRTILLVTLCIT